MIHAVGKAAANGREPRLVELEWGPADAPRVAIVGKGVVFDSGGLDIKPAAATKLMKKDMGGAAHTLALAGLVMANHLQKIGRASSRGRVGQYVSVSGVAVHLIQNILTNIDRNKTLTKTNKTR